MSSDNLRRIESAPEALSVSYNSLTQRVHLRIRKTLTPKEARELAVELFYQADAAEGSADANMQAFGYEATDSRDLAELRSLIDEEIGWGDDTQEIDGDYEARIRQVGRILKQRHLQLVNQ